MTFKKKLIEVALPLEAINVASAREKSIRHGHPSTLHLWWARRPLAAARAVIFAQMVDDPSTYLDVLRGDPKLVRKAEALLESRMKVWEEARTLAERAKGTSLSVPEPGPKPTLDEMLADQERQRLFRIIEDLVKWENTTNEKVLQAARDEIWQSWRRTCAGNAGDPRAKELFDRKKLPAFHDPFAGGGALPLEAQRLGLESYASDLNPVAVLINKAMIEIPPKFAGREPVNPSWQSKCDDEKAMTQWRGAQGLAEDVRNYGQWMRDEAEKRIGHLYPKLEITAEMVKVRPDLRKYAGRKLTVIAWIWARTVKSPNPAFAKVDVPLASTFMLCTRAGKEVYVEPIVENGGYRFTVEVGTPKDKEAAKNGTKLSRGANFQCLMSGTPIASDHIYTEANAGRMGAKLMAIVAEAGSERIYVAPTIEMETIALAARPTWKPDVAMPENPRWFSPPLYGLKTFGDLFTPRQLVALTTFCDLAKDVRERVKRDALSAGVLDDRQHVRDGGAGATAYAEAVGLYLGFCVDKMTDTNTCLCSWQVDPPRLRATFGRQALPMVWDYAEANIFGDAAGDFGRCVGSLTEVLDKGGLSGIGAAHQMDAQSLTIDAPRIISTDPPYYDNIGYADLSDFFYVWLRRSLQAVYPDLFATVAVPKSAELVATPYRHGGKEKAETFFLHGMTNAMHRIAEQGHPAFPVTIYYAFKQTESQSESGTSSTGWETFLDAVIRAGFGISGTWPMRSELATRNVGRDANALASSIILVCRQRAVDAPTATRREFLAALKAELPTALAHLQRGNIAPVDLAQAAIGPGMGVYTRFSKVVDAQGNALPVREALALINQTLDEALAEQEGDFDADSRWALTWFEQVGFEEGEYGVANVLAQAKNTSVEGMKQAGILASKSGRVRLLNPDELPEDWDPATDARVTTWETVHQLIRVLKTGGGERAAAELLAKLGAKAEVARELAYRLYTLCERKKRTEDALAYNGLVQSWPEIARIAQEGSRAQAPIAADLFDQVKS
jgi:putative DNA methylase